MVKDYSSRGLKFTSNRLSSIVGNDTKSITDSNTCIGCKSYIQDTINIIFSQADSASNIDLIKKVESNGTNINLIGTLDTQVTLKIKHTDWVGQVTRGQLASRKNINCAEGTLGAA
ncbi:MAG: hypothetical protein DWI25_03045 [Planctomycetota bacterium]|nr:MAG: hypothetical protein DWI25_03045 [Planctomycetota bacterium]